MRCLREASASNSAAGHVGLDERIELSVLAHPAADAQVVQIGSCATSHGNRFSRSMRTVGLNTTRTECSAPLQLVTIDSAAVAIRWIHGQPQ